MGLLGSVWVKLGLRNNDFQKGLKDSSDKLSGFGTMVKNVGNAMIYVWELVAASVIRLGKEFINQTQTIGDKWGIFTAELTAGWGMFIAGISSGQGWNELIGNISRAVDAARDAQMTLDELFERQNSYSIEAAKTRNEIAQLTTDMRDPSKSADERIAAAERVIVLEKQLGVLRQDISNQEYEAHKKNFQARTGLNDAQTEFLVDEYNKNRDIIQQAEEYNKKVREAKELESSFRSQSGDAIKWEDVLRARDAAAQLAKEIGQNGVEVAKLTNQYNIGNDKLVSDMVRAKVATISVSGEVTATTRRANTMLGTLKNSLATATSAAQTEASAHKGIINQLNDEIAAKTKLRDQATDRTEIEKLNQEIALLERKLGIIRKSGSETPVPIEAVKSPQLKVGILGKPLDAEEFITPIKGINDAMADNAQKFIAWRQTIEQQASAIGTAIDSGVVQAFDYLAEAIGSGEGIDPGKLISSILGPIGSMCISVGVAAMGLGETITAMYSALASPLGPIVAGAALVAIGTAMKIASSALGGMSGSSTSTSGISSNGNYSGGYGTVYANSSYNKEIEFRVKGQDLVAVMNAYNNQKYR